MSYFPQVEMSHSRLPRASGAGHGDDSDCEHHRDHARAGSTEGCATGRRPDDPDRPGCCALAITPRQLGRLLLRYKEEGPAGLVSRKRGRRSNHQLDEGLAVRALELIRDRYVDFGPTLAREKLIECHGISLGLETVRGLMIQAGLWTPRRDRAPKVHQPRNRRACLGELIQIDGSDHAWFEERGPSCTLLVFVGRLDEPSDAAVLCAHGNRRLRISRPSVPTSNATASPWPFTATRPQFSGATQDSAEFGRAATQFGRACFELNIDTFCANTSQAKGRVERANLTLQDRLVKEMRLRKILHS